MARPDSARLAWLVGAAVATTTATIAPVASAQTEPVQAPAVESQPASPPPASPQVTGPQLRNTLENCMGFWDAGTHMSRTEWQAACRRTLNGTNMDTDALDASPQDRAAGEVRKPRGQAKGSRR